MAAQPRGASRAIPSCRGTLLRECRGRPWGWVHPTGRGRVWELLPSMRVHSPAPLLPSQPVLPAWPLPSHSQDNDAPASGSCRKKSHVCTTAPSSESRSAPKSRVRAGESPCCPSRPCQGLQTHHIPRTAWDRFAVPTGTATHPEGRILGGFYQVRALCHPRDRCPGVLGAAAHPDTGSQEMLRGTHDGVSEKTLQLGAPGGAGPPPGGQPGQALSVPCLN